MSDSFKRIDLERLKNTLPPHRHMTVQEERLISAIVAAYDEIDRLKAENLELATQWRLVVDRLQAKIDYLHTLALEWTTVTDDPQTLPKTEESVVLRSAHTRFPNPDSWTSAYKSQLSGYWMTENGYEPICRGDKWTYIPKAIK